MCNSQPVIAAGATTILRNLDEGATAGGKGSCEGLYVWWGGKDGSEQESTRERARACGNKTEPEYRRRNERIRIFVLSSLAHGYPRPPVVSVLVCVCACVLPLTNVTVRCWQRQENALSCHHALRPYAVDSSPLVTLLTTHHRSTGYAQPFVWRSP